MFRVCHRCGREAVQGRSTCSEHGSPSPRGPSPYDYHHQQIAKQVVRQGCALAHMGGCEGPIQADHITPLSLGGSRERDNYQALCRRHNISKGGANRLR